MLYHRELSVWTSNMRRAKDTAREVKCANLVEWRSLREIEVRIRFINNTTMRGGIDLYPPVCLSVCLSIHQSIYLSIHLSIYLSICLSIHLSIYLSIHLSIHPFVYLSIHPFVYLSICLSIYPSICLSIHLSIYLSIHISMSLIRSYS